MGIERRKELCFLCAPETDLIFAKVEFFFAILGLGAIVEGFSILATKAHIPSMFDLSINEAEGLSIFSQIVRHKMKPYYGEVIMTEHGRIPLCKTHDIKSPESHCFHAHRLIFPITIDLTNPIKQLGLRIKEYPNFIEAKKNFHWNGEYLYYERTDGSCVVAACHSRLHRQFFRYIIADHIGRPELANWVRFPQIELVERAKNNLISEGNDVMD
jgi:hypothetical protein